jgi:hypothetical protein
MINKHRPFSGVVAISQISKYFIGTCINGNRMFDELIIKTIVIAVRTQPDNDPKSNE